MKLTAEETERFRIKDEIVAPAKLEYKKVGSIILKPGMTLYAFSFETGILEPVKIDRKETMIGFDGKPVKNARAEYNPKALYIQALNTKNAERKLMKFLIKNNLINHEADSRRSGKNIPQKRIS